MLMIVAHHFSMHGGFPYINDDPLYKGFLQFFGAGGKIGVIVFLLISGYFLVKSTFSWRKLGRLVVQIWGYSLAAIAVAFCLGLPLGDDRKLVRYLLPLGYMSWFAHSYLILFLLSPFINKLLLSAKKKWLQWFLFLGVLLWYLLPTVSGLVGESVHVGKSTTIQFIFVYVVGAYIRLYGERIHISHGFWKAMALYVGIVALDTLCYWLGLLSLDEEPWAFSYFGDINSPVALAASVCLFLAFKQFKIPHSKLINGIAATTFGIYLIHDNNLLRYFIWQDLLHVSGWYDSPFLPLYAVTMVLIVFSTCGFIDFLRLKYLEPHYSRWIDRLVARWEK